MSVNRCLRGAHLCLTLAAALSISSAPLARAQPGNGAVIYTYDALGRVTGASYDNNTTITYSYDAAGNRIQQSVAIGSPPGSPPGPPPTPGLLPGSSQWTTVGSGIYYNGGNVGVGTTNPTASLHVTGNGQLKITSTTSGIPPHVYMSDGTRDYAAGVFGSIYSIRDYTAGGVDRFVVDGTGNVGIGTASPTTSLQVQSGPVNDATRLRITNSSGAGRNWDLGVFGAGISGFEGVFGIGDITAGVWRLIVDTSGNVAIGQIAPAHTLHVNGTAYAAGAAGALSDRRYKDKIKPLALDGLATVEKLRPVSFVWKSPKDDGMKGIQFGFIAQDVEKVLPQIVLTAKDKDKTKGLKYDELIPVLTFAVQQLKAANESEAQEIQALRSDIEKLKSNQVAAVGQ